MAGRTFRNAIELDEYLANLTPEEREALKPGGAYGDQLRAAVADGVNEREQRLGKKARWVPHEGVPDWVRLGMFDTALKWSHNTVLTCVHQPRPERPQPVYAAAWKPGVVVCASCTPLLKATGVADTVCDGCGHECGGLPDDPIYPVSVFAGMLCYQIGACSSCFTELEDTSGGDL